MSRRAYIAEHWQGLTRRSRLLLVVTGAVLVLFTLFHFNTNTDQSQGHGRYLPQYLTHTPNPDHDYYGPPYGVESILANDTSAVYCDWADIDAHSTRKIREKAAPAFPLLSAWLKPEAARYGPALNKIPPALQEQFTLGGRVRFQKFFFDQAYLGGKALQAVWTIADIDHYRHEVRRRSVQFTYANAPLYDALDRWADLAVRGKRGLVIGSETPWLEAMLLEYGAEHISTLEFGAIQTDHPQLTTFTPQEFTLKFLQGAIPPFDFAFSYSSLEHDGLGRYGDVLNPLGDLQSMARMLSAVRPGGFMFLGVPCCEDALYWNAHRVYGPMRYSEMFAGWRTLGSAPADAMEGRRGGRDDWLFQPVWALQNRMGCRGGTRAADVTDLGKAFSGGRE